MTVTMEATKTGLTTATATAPPPLSHRRVPVTMTSWDAPRIIVNAKVYPQVTGRDRVLRLAEACQVAGEAADTRIGLAPPHLELSALAAAAREAGWNHVALYAQHTDPLVPGSGTGWVTAEAVQATGAVGSLLNHAEHKVPHSEVAATLERLHALGLETVVCADSMDETRALAPLQPTYLAVEPPALIGGDVSVTRADPAIVQDAAAAVLELAPTTLPFCGAGVKDGRDVAAAIRLGAYGVLLASGVVKADDPLAVLRDLSTGLP
jgi:triosephosphate isomerase (TIM)